MSNQIRMTEFKKIISPTHYSSMFLWHEEK